ncbi:AAA family ATPase [Shewanella algae]|uniref:ATP-dependent nuclease n=1 Tax=Shewanella algae TaxID=38313 RepID=UPI001AAD4A12|nr:AAA family ATPase [Shewanella algae]MBO2568879.1 AAA family ATPase [Shewanella algae]
MRLKHVYISNYKNLKNFEVKFTGESFVDVFVGCNGSGKSNFFEALIVIFRHLYEFGKVDALIYDFDYKLRYEVNGIDVSFGFVAGSKTIEYNGVERKTLSGITLPDNLLVYYSGQNTTVSELLDTYESLFKDKVQGAKVTDARKFIGVGNQYKNLLLSLLLALPDGNKAKAFVKSKLKILDVSPELCIKLKRPDYARGNGKFDIVAADDMQTAYWSAAGVVRAFLDIISASISIDTAEIPRAEGYSANDDLYIHYYNIIQLNELIKDQGPLYLFRMLDNMKLIGMLDDISVKITLENGFDASIAHFSDGQFQSIYIYAIAELFKDSNCITLLDEPDAFLHPEWQHGFLKQVDEISDGAAKTNHVLMSSHSAVTLISHDGNKIKFFDLKDAASNCYELPKVVAVNRLSSNIIKYSVQEQLLSILQRIQTENKPVLFTEGHTDAKIITEAWSKLYQSEMPFIPFYAFSCTFINNLIRDERIHAEMRGNPVFALFDFDQAFNQWNGLNGEIVVDNVNQGLVKKWAGGNAYAFMLPVPSNAEVRKQVIKNETTLEHFGEASYCAVEHLFYGIDGANRYFSRVANPGGEIIKFSNDGEKTGFSENFVPTLDAAHFEIFRPMLEFIISKITPNLKQAV